MSSGRPARRTGVSSAWCSTLPPSSPRSSDARSIGVSTKPGRDGVDGDALGTELERQRLGEADEAGLRRDVVDHVLLTGLRARRRDVDDAAPPGLDHVGHHGLGAVEGPAEVDRHDAVPLLVGDRQELVEAGDARVVDEHERGSELRCARARRRRPPGRGPTRRRRRRRSPRGPSARSSSATSAAASSLRSSSATASPSAARRMAMARPMPDPRSRHDGRTRRSLTRSPLRRRWSFDA